MQLIKYPFFNLDGLGNEEGSTGDEGVDGEDSDDEDAPPGAGTMLEALPSFIVELAGAPKVVMSQS
jgi:hypothetical protein